MAGVFPALPLDLAQYIIQIAAHQDLHSAVSLSSVSKLVQSWSDPSLFRTITLKRYPHSILSEVSSRNITSIRLIRARKFIRRVSVVDRIPRGHLDRLLSCCPNLSCLGMAIDISTFNGALIVAPPSLRRIYIKPLRAHAQTLNIPFFQNITHLAFIHSSHLEYYGHIDALQRAATQLRSLPNVTHFCANILIEQISTFFTVMPDASLGPLANKFQVFLLYVDCREMPILASPWRDLASKGNLDSRFVALLNLPRIFLEGMDHSFHDVLVIQEPRRMAGHIEVDKYWSLAEGIVAKRLNRTM
ncbi:hypothetical protein DL96DRAFT_1615392 [Flagelloscypha sp. PMI_526]|nr:hypothetical protein DL96DRAFT_1615392 [Flagelloscypha sp. PMI_526]